MNEEINKNQSVDKNEGKKINQMQKSEEVQAESEVSKVELEEKSGFSIVTTEDLEAMRTSKIQENKTAVDHLGVDVSLLSDEIEDAKKILQEGILNWADDKKSMLKSVEAVLTGSNKKYLSQLTSEVLTEDGAWIDCDLNKISFPSDPGLVIKDKRFPLQASKYLAIKQKEGIHYIQIDISDKKGIISTLNKIIKESIYGASMFIFVLNHMDMMKELFETLMDGKFMNRLSYDMLRHADTAMTISLSNIIRLIDDNIAPYWTQYSESLRLTTDQDQFKLIVMLNFILTWRHKIVFSTVTDNVIIYDKKYHYETPITNLDVIISQVSQRHVAVQLLELLDTFKFDSDEDAVAGKKDNSSRRLMFFDDTYVCRLNHFSNAVFAKSRELQQYHQTADVLGILYLYKRGFVTAPIEANYIKELLDMHELDSLFSILQIEVASFTNLKTTVGLAEVLRKTRWMKGVISDLYKFIFIDANPFFEIKPIIDFGKSFRELAATNSLGDLVHYGIYQESRRSETVNMFNKASDKNQLYAKHESDVKAFTERMYQNCSDKFYEVFTDFDKLLGRPLLNNYRIIAPDFLASKEYSNTLKAILLCMSKGIEVNVALPFTVLQARGDLIAKLLEIASMNRVDFEKLDKTSFDAELARLKIDSLIPFNLNHFELCYRVNNPKRRLGKLMMDVLDDNFYTNNVYLALIANHMNREPLYGSNQHVIGKVEPLKRNNLYICKSEFVRISRFSTHEFSDSISTTISYKLAFLSDKILQKQSIQLAMRRLLGLKGDLPEYILNDSSRFAYQKLLYSRYKLMMQIRDREWMDCLEVVIDKSQKDTLVYEREVQRSNLLAEFLSSIFSSPQVELFVNEFSVNILRLISQKETDDKTLMLRYLKDPFILSCVKRILRVNAYKIINNELLVIHPKIFDDIYNQITQSTCILFWSAN